MSPKWLNKAGERRRRQEEQLVGLFECACEFSLAGANRQEYRQLWVLDRAQCSYCIGLCISWVLQFFHSLISPPLCLHSVSTDKKFCASLCSGCEHLLSSSSTAFSFSLFSIPVCDSFITSLLHTCCATATHLLIFLSVHNTVSPAYLCCVHVSVISGASHYSLFLFVSKAGARNQFNPGEYSSFSVLFLPSLITIFCLLSFPPCPNKTRLLIFLNAEAYLITVVIRQPELNSRGALAEQ